MEKRSGNFKEYLLERLKDPQERAGYINAALEDGDPGILLACLNDCAKAMGGKTWLSHEAHLSRQAITAIVSKNGNPKYRNLTRVLAPMGLRIKVEATIGTRHKQLARA
jgi:probable addiction module antidote protein